MSSQIPTSTQIKNKSFVDTAGGRNYWVKDAIEKEMNKDIYTPIDGDNCWKRQPSLPMPAYISNSLTPNYTELHSAIRTARGSIDNRISAKQTVKKVINPNSKKILNTFDFE